ncbi:MAG: hypothetical protein E6G89_01620 [Alphaproteobacteria bacterium]|nr:MAG: hypothetical protein E6G89_01620 [Alphaproteobacteria bacterium]
MALTVVAQTLIANVWLAGTFRRTTARGMPAATVTPDISNDGRRGANPVSGVLLDLAAFSVQPTLEADDWGPNISASQQANAPEGFFSTHRWQGSGLYIPPGTGIALIQTEAISSPAFEISLSWLED